MRAITLCALSLLHAITVAASEPPDRPTCPAGPEAPFEDDLLDRLTGDWILTGTMKGRELLQECSAEWVLHHKFLRLECRETRDPPLLGIRYESTMYIGCSSATRRYVANLVDIFGAGESLGFGRRTGDAIAFVWESPDGAFENTFSWNASARAWTSSLRQKNRAGTWAVWGEKRLRRREGGESPRH